MGGGHMVGAPWLLFSLRVSLVRTKEKEEKGWAIREKKGVGPEWGGFGPAKVFSSGFKSFTYLFFCFSVFKKNRKRREIETFSKINSFKKIYNLIY